MTPEQLYRDECDTIRLLIDEFETTGARHFIENADKINIMQVRDWDEYVQPKAIPAIFGFLTGSLLVHCISLLEFRLPILLIHSLLAAGRVVPSKLQTFRDGNIIVWMKNVVKETNGANFDFDDPLVERIEAWIRVRNDEVHYGGYRSERTKQRQIDILDGVDVGDVGTTPYDIQFVGCRNAIHDVEAFFRKTESIRAATTT